MSENHHEQLLDEAMAQAIASLDCQSPLLAGMGRYQLGLVTETFTSISAEAIGAHRGKRLRPRLAMLTCEAVGGQAAIAAPLAAAIEMLHNFTLVHDDIQDQSPTRRHRPTVWTIWGTAQAINSGDALFATAHLALYHLQTLEIDPATVLRLAAAFDQVTIDIVGGQTRDLEFEGRPGVTAQDYLAMISGKTAAIVRYATWSGALLGGADDATSETLAEFGLALGLGFQIRDDLLGIWGSQLDTGKAEADDIRRRKQSLPILMLRERVPEAVRRELDVLYDRPEIHPAGVSRVLELLADYEIRAEIDGQVEHYHDLAIEALTTALPENDSPSRAALLALIDQLATRIG